MLLTAFGAALMLAITCVFAAPAHAATIEKTQTQLGYQTYAIDLQKGAVKIDLTAGATIADAGIFTEVDSSGYGKGSIAHAYVNDPYGKKTVYGGVAKSGRYYLVMYASKYSGATGSKATITNYPLAQKTITVGKAATGTSCGDGTTVAYYKVKVAKRGLLTIDATEESGDHASVSVRLCNSKKKAFGDSWKYLYDGKKTYFGAKKGTYLLAVKSSEPVYKIKATLKAVTKAGGAKKAKAVTIKKGKVMKGVLAAGEKARWYKFKVTKAKKYTIALNAKTDYSGIKMEFSGTGYYNQNFYLGDYAATKTVKTNKLKPGTYYVKVYPYSSSDKGGNGYFTIKWK